jgi:two-component system response regulator AtoC
MFDRVLILEPREPRRERLAVLLSEEGASVATADDTKTALASLVRSPIDLVFCAADARGIDGFDPLPQLLRLDPALIVILTPPAHADPSTLAAERLAAAAIERGAWDVLTEPDRPSIVRLVYRRALEHARTRRSHARLRREIASRASDLPIVAASDEMIDLLEQLDRTAASETSVLITGERGSGKEAIAHALHAQSTRRAAPFVRIDCSTPEPDRVLADLFGEAPESVGARGRTDGPPPRRGGLEEARGGMLYLHELTLLPDPGQIALLRALQTREILLPGTGKPVAIDVRVVAGTSASLEHALATGQLRAELLEGLGSVRLEVPPLRERRIDLPLLVDHLLRRLRNRRGEPIRRIGDDTLESLLAHRWPGNLRELELVVESAALRCESDSLELDSLPADLVGGGRGATPSRREPGMEPEESLHLKPARRAFEADLIRRALARTGGNRTHAARLLAISHRSLLYKIREHGLND